MVKMLSPTPARPEPGGFSGDLDAVGAAQKNVPGLEEEEREAPRLYPDINERDAAAVKRLLWAGLPLE